MEKSIWFLKTMTSKNNESEFNENMDFKEEKIRYWAWLVYHSKIENICHNDLLLDQDNDHQDSSFITDNQI